MSEMENIITDSIVVLLSTAAILLDVLLLKAISSNKGLKTHFYVVYGAYTFNGAIGASGYGFKSVLHVVFTNDKSLSYIPWWMCHLVADVLGFSECNYTCFIFVVSVVRFTALVHPVKFQHITIKHAFVAVVLQQVFVPIVSGFGYINSNFHSTVSCLIVHFALSNISSYIATFTFLLLIVSVTLYICGYYAAKRRTNTIADQRMDWNHFRELKNMTPLMKIILSFRIVGYVIGGTFIYVSSISTNVMPEFFTINQISQYTSIFFVLDKLCEPAYTMLKLNWAKKFCISLFRCHHLPAVSTTTGMVARNRITVINVRPATNPQSPCQN